ncbi:MAG TPA: ATPase, partial [Thermoanaerobaculia bacterium]
MFEEYFGFTTKPFGKTPDPAFLYESAQHKEALARLEYAVEEKELALLT